MKKDIFKSAQNILLIIAGSVIYSAGMGLFFKPEQACARRRDRHCGNNQRRDRLSHRYHRFYTQYPAAYNSRDSVRLQIFFNYGYSHGSVVAFDRPICGVCTRHRRSFALCVCPAGH